MAEFLEERMPVAIRLGASTNEDYAVEITLTASDSEYRRLIHALPRRRWRVKYTLQRDEMVNAVESLYHRTYGRYAGFRVVCLDDQTTAADGHSPPTALDHTLSRISSGIYQLVKRYGVGGTPISIGLPTRTLYKPVAGTTLIAKNGITVGSGVSVDTTTGRVTITPAPLITDVITGGCRFDIPARFDSELQVTSLGADVRDTAEFDLIELLTP